jgi:REP element-mobilizing transposase RayT
VAHTYTSDLVHCVFSTQNRRKSISADLQPKLWAYLGGIARKNNFHALAVGGTEDHVHILLSLPACMPVSKAVQLLKGGSSKWIHDSTKHAFAWQEGYGAFTVGISQKANTIAYIAGQAQHHAKRSFEEEFIAFLKKHDIEYDPQYILG